MTVKWLSPTMVLAIGLLVQQHPERFPPNQFCTPAGDVRVEPGGGRTKLNEAGCACRRAETADDHKSCEEGEPISPNKDPICRQYCHENGPRGEANGGQCWCPISCDAGRERFLAKKTVEHFNLLGLWSWLSGRGQS